MSIRLPSIYPVACHTDNIGPGSIFVAIQGDNYCGASFIKKAIKKGAKQVVLQKGMILPKDSKQCIEKADILCTTVENTRHELAKLSAKKAGFPAKQLKIIGITGTKGKTTTAYLLEHILKKAGYKTALLSTVENKIDTQSMSAQLTTEHPDYLHQFFKLCVQNGVTHVVMEVAAQALSLHRVDGIAFDGIIFTNFSQEHAEFYPHLDDYFNAKCTLFKKAKKDAVIIINSDDPKLNQFKKRYKTISLQDPEADYYVTLQDSKDNLSGKLLHNNAQMPFEITSLCGTFNAYNSLAALAIAHNFKIPINSALSALSESVTIPGRFEKYHLPNGALCVIDYAHNPSSFTSILSTMRSLTDHLICVFGAGGKRDSKKRPLMGKVAADFCDLVIITSDNPRTEDPLQIINEIKQGVPLANQNKVICEVDREKAIKKAYKYSKKNSIIALLGKGPDEYQIFNNKKVYFSEKKIIFSL